MSTIEWRTIPTFLHAAFNFNFYGGKAVRRNLRFVNTDQHKRGAEFFFFLGAFFFYGAAFSSIKIFPRFTQRKERKLRQRLGTETILFTFTRPDKNPR